MPIELKIIGETAKDVIGELLTFGDFYVRPSAGIAPETTDTDDLKEQRDGSVRQATDEPTTVAASPAASAQPGTAENAATHDSAGLPWDERIHSSNKAFNADGTWRRRRGVSDDLVKRIEAELRGGAAPATSTTAEVGAQVGTSETPETEAQDEADEQAESEASKKELSRDDVRAVLGKYVQKYGMDAAQEDGPKVIAMMFGEGKNKVSDIPEDQASLAKAVAGVEEMLVKNPFKRAEVA